ncbi:MAG: chloride channel protein [Syntrophorhabdales bacterium]|nr:chloride channel protein [Syntrophorhabdales bacterium]
MCQIFSHIFDKPAAFVLVGMGDFFTGIAKTPIAALIMVAEMTGGYSLILPMMIVSSISFLLLGRISLYEKQASMRIDSPAHIGDYSFDILKNLSVKDAIANNRKVDTIP